MRRALWLSLLLIACRDEGFGYLPAPRPQPDAAVRRTLPKEITKLRIGLVPYINPDDLRRAHEPLTAYLSQVLGVPVEVVLGDSYDSVGGMLERKEVELAELSPYAYVRASRRAPVRPLVTAINDGSETAGGYIFVRGDSPRKSFADLKGASFGFVDRASTSGYLYPMKMLKDRGLSADTFFSRVEFLGNHENVLEAVLSGKVEAGATYQGSMQALKRNRGVDPLSFRIIAKTPRTPRDLVLVRGDLPAAVGDAVIDALVGISSRDARGRAVLAPLNMNGFFPADDHLYDPVREADTELEGPAK